MNMDAILRMMEQVHQITRDNNPQNKINGLVSQFMSQGNQIAKERADFLSNLMQDRRQQANFEQQNAMQARQFEQQDKMFDMQRKAQQGKEHAKINTDITDVLKKSLAYEEVTESAGKLADNIENNTETQDALDKVSKILNNQSAASNKVISIFAGTGKENEKAITDLENLSTKINSSNVAASKNPLVKLLLENEMTSKDVEKVLVILNDIKEISSKQASAATGKQTVFSLRQFLSGKSATFYLGSEGVGSFFDSIAKKSANEAIEFYESKVPIIKDRYGDAASQTLDMYKKKFESNAAGVEKDRIFSEQRLKNKIQDYAKERNLDIKKINEQYQQLDPKLTPKQAYDALISQFENPNEEAIQNAIQEIIE